MTTFDMNRAAEYAFNKIDVYAIYLRKSRADMKAEALGEGETLARHKKILLDLAERRGLYVGKIYEEIVSGDTIDARPEIQKLIQDCYDGMYKGILIIEVTRLSRGSQGDAQIILDCLKYSNRSNGLLVVTPTKVYDVAHSQEDEEYIEFELFMSRREYKMINKRMDRGRKQAVVEGNYMGTNRPYGYDILTTQTSRTLKPNEDEAPIVKQIFEWAVKQNLSNLQIARRLSAMGVPTYTGNPVWSKDSVKTILMNPVYVGKVRWNTRMKVKTMVNGELKAMRPRTKSDLYMVYEGKHKKYALVSDEVFAEAQKKFYFDRTRTNLKLMNPLAGLLYCEKCKKPMRWINQRNGTIRFSHPNSVVGCSVKSALASDILAAVTHGLQKYIDDCNIKVDSTPEIDESTVKNKINALEKEIKKIKGKISTLFDMREEQEISSNEFVERKATHTARIEVLEKEIEDLEYSMPEKQEYEERLLLLSDAFIAITDDELEATDKNMFLKKIVKKIEFSRENDEEFILDMDLR